MVARSGRTFRRGRVSQPLLDERIKGRSFGGRSFGLGTSPLSRPETSPCNRSRRFKERRASSAMDFNSTPLSSNSKRNWSFLSRKRSEASPRCQRSGEPAVLPLTRRGKIPSRFFRPGFKHSKLLFQQPCLRPCPIPTPAKLPLRSRWSRSPPRGTL